MAGIMADSFNHLADADKASKWTQYIAGAGNQTAGSFTIAAVGPRANNGLKILPGADGTGNAHSGSFNVVPSMPAPSGDTVIFGFRIKPPAATTLRAGTNSEVSGSTGTACLAAVRSSGTTLFWLRLNTDLTVSVYVGSTLKGTSSSALTQGVWSYLECKVKLNNGAGTIDLQINGFNKLTLAAQVTNNGGSTTWNEFRFGEISASNTVNPSIEIDVADFYLLDGSGAANNGFLGDVRVDPSFPNANGNYSQWTRSAGADQYATIDENPANGDVDYNSSGVVGDTDSVNYPAAPVAGANILMIQVCGQVRKSDAGSSGLKMLTRQGGVDYLGTEYGIPTSYAVNRQVWDLNPATGLAWTETDFNNAEFGYKKTS